MLNFQGFPGDGLELGTYFSALFPFHSTRFCKKLLAFVWRSQGLNSRPLYRYFSFLPLPVWGRGCFFVVDAVPARVALQHSKL